MKQENGWIHWIHPFDTLIGIYNTLINMILALEMI